MHVQIASTFDPLDEFDDAEFIARFPNQSTVVTTTGTLARMHSEQFVRNVAVGVQNRLQ